MNQGELPNLSSTGQQLLSPGEFLAFCAAGAPFSLRAAPASVEFLEVVWTSSQARQLVHARDVPDGFGSMDANPNQKTIMPTQLAAPNKPARRSRPLKAEQMWTKVIWPLTKLRDRLKKINDPALPEIVKQLEAMQGVLFDLRDRRALAEAQAADKGEISWMVFHPRGKTIFDLNRIVTRTPRTIHVKNEYWTQPDSARLAEARSVLEDLDKELHREPLDLAKFAEHARYVEESYRRYLARGGAEGETAKEAA